MKDFIESTVGRFVLLIIVGIIWGINAFRYSDVFTKTEKAGQLTTNIIDITGISNTRNDTFTYQKTGRDPFNPVVDPPTGAALESPGALPYRPPQINVLGVMDQTIMISDETREIILLKEAEIYNGIKVTKITPDSVIFTYRNRSFVIKVKS